jgi:hypothetical protein
VGSFELIGIRAAMLNESAPKPSRRATQQSQNSDIENFDADFADFRGFESCFNSR